MKITKAFTNAGTMVPSVDNTTLSSKRRGGVSGEALVTARNNNYQSEVAVLCE